MLKVSFLCIWVICILVCGVKAFFSFQLRLYDFFEDWLFSRFLAFSSFLALLTSAKLQERFFVKLQHFSKGVFLPPVKNLTFVYFNFSKDSLF